MMDAKEALKELEDLSVDYGNRNEEQIARLDEAIDKAIDALKAQADGDTISRREAIDAIIAEGRNVDSRYLESERIIHESDAVEAISMLPSSQPEPIRINLNEPIKVKLTDWGKEIYYHQYDRTNQIAGREICKPRFPREDENGYTEFQLWCFIELYGVHMGMTLPNVIEPLEIVYER